MSKSNKASSFCKGCESYTAKFFFLIINFPLTTVSCYSVSLPLAATANESKRIGRLQDLRVQSLLSLDRIRAWTVARGRSGRRAVRRHGALDAVGGVVRWVLLLLDTVEGLLGQVRITEAGIAGGLVGHRWSLGLDGGQTLVLSGWPAAVRSVSGQSRSDWIRLHYVRWMKSELTRSHYITSDQITFGLTYKVACQSDADLSDDW